MPWLRCWSCGGLSREGVVLSVVGTQSLWLSMADSGTEVVGGSHGEEREGYEAKGSLLRALKGLSMSLCRRG